MSKEWNDIYARGEQNNRWPWTDLVSLVKRHCGDIADWRVLELGCGTGCNRQFFLNEGASYVGIDQVENDPMAHLIGEHSSFEQGDFTKELPEGPFDLICDRAAVTHNTTEGIQNTLKLVHEALNPGGMYIGVDWFSKAHWCSLRGKHVDSFTRTDIPDGQFKGCGEVHFSTMAHLEKLFVDFEVIDSTHKKRCSQMESGRRFASWDIVARKQK